MYGLATVKVDLGPLPFRSIALESSSIQMASSAMGVVTE